MSLSQRNDSPINGELMQKVIIENDVSKLSAMEKVMYVKSVCQSLGLNPLTKPIQLIKFQGKEVPYFTKDASEQLRKINQVSIYKLEKETFEGIFTVTAHAKLPDGREDCSTGSVSIAGLKGELLSNAAMKAETKAKRRVTLSICGLGHLDESEIDSIPGATRVVMPANEAIEHKPEMKKLGLEISFTGFMAEMCEAANLKELERVYKAAKMIDWSGTDFLQKLVTQKDKRKSELTVAEFTKEYDNADAAEITEVTEDGEIVQ